MKKETLIPKKVPTLRKKAEKLLRAAKRDVAAMPVEDTQQLVHELQVHQIELEIQNEELRRIQLELEASRDRYVELYDRAPTGYLTLNLKGMTLEANLPACALLGVSRKDLLDQPVIRFVAAKDQAAFLSHSRKLYATGTRQACEVDLARQGGGTALRSPRSWTSQSATAQKRRCARIIMSVNGSAMTSMTRFSSPSMR